MSLFSEDEVRNLKTHNMMMIVPYRMDIDQVNESGNAVVKSELAIKDLVAYGCHDCELPLELALRAPCTGPAEEMPNEGALH